MYGTITFQERRVEDWDEKYFVRGGIRHDECKGDLSPTDYSFRVADNPSGKGRYFGPAHIAINAVQMK